MKKKLTVFLVMLLMLLFSTEVFAAIPSISGTRYIKTFGLSTANNTPVYTNARLNQQGTSSPFKAYNALIYASDEIYIFAMNNTYALISYPTSSGRKQGYVRTSSLTVNNFSQNPLKSHNGNRVFTTYRRPGGPSYGSISNGDSVWTVARTGNYTQVVYPTGNTYKMAWITNSDYNNYVLPPSPSQGAVAGLNPVIVQQTNQWDNLAKNRAKPNINLSSECYIPLTPGKNPFKKSYYDDDPPNKPPYKYHATNCTWYAIGRYREVNGRWLGVTGKPSSWIQEAKNKGFSTGDKARSKSVGVGSKHVMFIEYADDNYAYITEANYGDDFIVKKFSLDALKRDRGITNFIYP